MREGGESYKSILACITPTIDAFDADVSGSASSGSIGDGSSEISWKGGNWGREEHYREEGEERFDGDVHFDVLIRDCEVCFREDEVRVGVWDR